MMPEPPPFSWKGSTSQRNVAVVRRGTGIGWHASLPQTATLEKHLQFLGTHLECAGDTVIGRPLMAGDEADEAGGKIADAAPDGGVVHHIEGDAQAEEDADHLVASDVADPDPGRILVDAVSG